MGDIDFRRAIAEAESSSLSTYLDTLPPDMMCGENGAAFLCLATTFGNNRCAVVKLIQNRANVNGKPVFFMKTPLRHAILKGESCMIDILISAGAKVEQSDLDSCILMDDYRIASILMSSGLRLRNTRVVCQGMIPRTFRNFERGLLSCRSVVITLLGIKLHRGFIMRHIDRFLIRHLAVEIWTTRNENQWQN